MVVTDTLVNPAQTGIQTVVRGLIAGLRRAKQPFHLVQWLPENQEFFRLRPEISASLGKPRESKFMSVTVLLQPKNWSLVRNAKARNYRIPIHCHPGHRNVLEKAWLLIPELLYLGHAAHIIEHARQVRLRVAAIFHDAIPVTHPELVRPAVVKDHADYMRALTRADAVLAVSDESANAFTRFAVANGLPHDHVIVCAEPAELLGAKRVTKPAPSDPHAIHVLCVSTLEPRKNHRVLIEAFEDFLAASPNRNAFLHLVGDSYDAVPEIAELVTATTRRNPRIRWHGKVSQAELMDLYGLTDFTVYPSFLEGFGLPVVESLWLGKPCVCANFGAVQEIAAAGGCFMVDVRERRALAEAITALATRPELRQSLTDQAVTRPLKTWRDYAVGIREALTRIQPA